MQRLKIGKAEVGRDDSDMIACGVSVSYCVHDSHMKAKLMYHIIAVSYILVPHVCNE